MGALHTRYMLQLQGSVLIATQVLTVCDLFGYLVGENA